VAYATDEIAFDEKMARATVMESRSWEAWVVFSGSPTSQRFTIIMIIIAQKEEVAHRRRSPCG
jgi:hypothetical protein